MEPSRRHRTWNKLAIQPIVYMEEEDYLEEERIQQEQKAKTTTNTATAIQHPEITSTTPWL